MTTSIERRLVRDQVRDLVVEWIRSSELAPGMKIGESALSERLGVSRTPLREALICLAQEGMIDSTPGKGFQVPCLSLEDVAEIYSLRGALEHRALQWAGEATVKHVPALRRINDALLRAGANVGRWIELDRQFHTLLVSECPNKRLLQMIGRVRDQGTRYGFLYRESDLCIEPTVEQHSAVIEAIANRELARAADLLEANWSFGLRQISQKLSAH